MIKKSLLLASLIATTCFTSSVFAYGSSSTNNGCKKPRFKTFNPTAYSADNKIEVESESEISFTVSKNADPKTITAVAKKIPLKLNIENKLSFYEVTAKLPPELKGKYARIHLSAEGMLGCEGKDGWLIKIKK